MAVPSSIIQGAPEEQDTVESKFAIGEMYSVIPCHIRNELFDHLDLRQASRLSRVSTAWASELMQIPKRTKGTAVLEDFLSGGRMEKLRKIHEDTEDQAYLFVWLPVFLALPKSIDVTHLILVDQVKPHGRNIWDMSDQDEDKEWFLQVIPPLKRITISTLCRDTLEEIRDLWWVSVETLVFSKLAVEFYSWCEVHDPTEHCKTLFDAEVRRSFCEDSGNGTMGVRFFILYWSLEVQCLDIKLTKGTCNYDHSDDLKWLWRLLDSRHAIWPYPEAQVQWLMRSLNDLQGEVLQTVKYLDEQWRAQRLVGKFFTWFLQEHPMSLLTPDVAGETSIAGKATTYFYSEIDTPELWDTLDKYDFTMWDERKLTSLDLGFLGRLLVKIDQYQKIPGLVAPPYAFPDDLYFSCS